MIVSKSKTINGIRFTPILINKTKELLTIGWLIQEKKKKILYIPCDVKPFNIENKFLQNIDILIVNGPWLQTKNGLKNINTKHPLRNELFSMDELVDLINKNKIKKTIIVHIEEMWRLSYDDYNKIEKQYKKYDIKFAYDGMNINI